MRNIRLLPVAAVTLSLLAPASAIAAPASPTRACVQTYTRADFHELAGRIFGRDREATRHERRMLHRRVACQRYPRSLPIVLMHVRRYRAHHHRLLVDARAWAYIRTHPMPYCTWGPESGGDYTARNPTSTAGGKYQILDSTWYANGGSYYPDSHPAAAAPPLEQEIVARRVLASQGPGAWVNCN